MKITKIKDLSCYTTILIENGNQIGKVHIPNFENGQVLIRFCDENSIVNKTDEIEINFQKKD